MNKLLIRIIAVMALIAFVATFNYGGCGGTSDSGSSGGAALAPTVTTLAATYVTIDSAQLNGTVNPNGYSTTAAFQWGTTTGYGNYTPSQSLGAGTGILTVSDNLSGLNFETTYYFRLRAQNANGISYSSGWSFTTSSPTQPPYKVATPSPANGASNVSLAPILSWAVATYAASYNIYCGTTYPPSTFKGNTTNTYWNSDAIGYSTTYYWRIDSVNSAGTTTGDIWNFVTQLPQKPSVSYPTPSATNITNNAATLNCLVNPQALSTTAWFEYGQTTGYGLSTSKQDIGSGLSLINVIANISGLTANTLYDFRAVANNSTGYTYGGNQFFTTLPVPPTVTTNIATNVLFASATLNGTVNPNNSLTNCYFQYAISPTTPSDTWKTGAQDKGAGASAVPISSTLISLDANNYFPVPYNIYNFRCVAYNAGGTTNGSILNFTTRNHPLSTDAVPQWSINQSPATAYAYRFTPTVNGQITALGRYIGSGTTGNTSLRLYNSTGTVLSSPNPVVVSPSSGWQWTTLGTPINVSAGTSYSVAVDCSPNLWYTTVDTGSYSYPINRGNITITGCYYDFAGTWPNTIATTGGNANVMFGWADIEFVPQ
jgi:hypothetical protein